MSWISSYKSQKQFNKDQKVFNNDQKLLKIRLLLVYLFAFYLIEKKNQAIKSSVKYRELLQSKMFLFFPFFMNDGKCKLQLLKNIKIIMSGKRERPEDFDIDEKTLEYKGEKKRKPNQESTPDQIAERKIFKIKRPDEGEKSSSQVNFSLFNGNGKQSAVNKQEKQNVASKKEESGEKKGADKEQNEDKNKKPFPSIFGDFAKSNSGSNSIFSSNSLFNNSSINNKSQTGGLFSNTSTSSIFNFSSTGAPPIKKDSLFNNLPDDASGDSEQLEKAQQLNADPSKSVGNYEYKNEGQSLFNQKAVKFKKNTGDLIENVQILVQQDNTEKRFTWIYVRLTATKNIIFSGILIKDKCEVKSFSGKEQNVSLVAAKVGEKLEKSTLKIQFENPDQGRAFIKVVEAID